MLKLNTSENVIKKRKQKLVKHKRKNWKKTDISEIEQSIDELKHELRTGGIRADKKDDELFFIDSKKNPTSKLDTFDEQTKSLQDAMNDLRCYRNLKADENSEPALLRNNKEKQLTSKKTSRKTDSIRSKIERQKPIKSSAKKDKEPNDNRFTFEHDLWTTNFNPEVNHTNEYFLRTTKKIMPKKPKNFDQKTSALPAVELPHPGMSYNPTYDEHQALLEKAHKIELEKLKKEERLIRNHDAKIPKMSHKQIEDIWISEMSASLVDREEEPERDVKDDIENYKPKNQQKKGKKEKLMEKKRDEEKKRRIRENEIYRLRTIKKEIHLDEEKRMKRIEKRQKLEKDKKLYGQSRLSAVKFEDQEIELKLSNEICGNLRNLKPEGNVFVDRYKSMQKRNIVEPRKRAKRQRENWTKTYEKKSVREITI